MTAAGIVETATGGPRIASLDEPDYIFRISPSTTMTSLINANWLIGLGLDKVDDVVLVAENTDYGLPAQATAAGALEAAGITPDPVDHEVTKSLYFDDPDGNNVEVYVDVSDVWRTEPQRVAQIEPLDI